MSNIQDVAKLAQVSVATVSRVINNSKNVSESSRNKVLQAIEQLGYQPNLLGRNLRRTETKMILVLLPNISNPFYSLIVKGIEDVAHENGYIIMLCNTDSQAEREMIYLDLLKNKLSDGVIFMAPEIEREELSVIGARFPVVQCCEYKEGADISHVLIDNYSAAQKVVRHLLSLGHKRIAMISCRNNFVSTIHREKAYRDVMQQAGLEIAGEFIAYGDYSFTSGLRCSLRLLKMDPRPTAIFCFSDMMAIGAIKAARELGLRVPEDVAVAGFDDIGFASLCEPPLTTVSQPKYDLGRSAMELLLRQLRGEVKGPENICLEHELVIRGSTIGSSPVAGSTTN